MSSHERSTTNFMNHYNGQNLVVGLDLLCAKNVNHISRYLDRLSVDRVDLLVGCL